MPKDVVRRATTSGRPILVDDRCSYCNNPTTTVVVEFTGNVVDACHPCSVSLVDPLFSDELPDSEGLERRYRLLIDNLS